MTSGADRFSNLAAFAARHASLLDGVAAAWSQAGAGHLAVRDAAGRVVYASGAATGPVLQAPLLDGALCLEASVPALGPVLAAQARLLEEFIRAEAESELVIDELVRTTDHLVALYEVSASARAGRDLADVMQTCVEQASRLTGAERGWLVVREREAWRAESAVRVFSFPGTQPIDPRRAADVLSSVQAHPEPAIANDAQLSAALSGGSFGDIRRLICAPMEIGGRVNAALCVVNKAADFTNGDLKLVAALADVIAGFLERERSFARELAQARVRRELEIAAEIQSRLLPRNVPSLPGVQVAASWQPSREVSGDFLDVQTLSVPGGDQLALALGDVTGKGVPAALLMAMALSLLRLGFASTGSPVGAARLVNSGLADDLSKADHLLTLFTATFNPASGALRAVNCGHSPVMVYHAGDVELWEADGPPLGVLPEMQSIERERELESGDALVVLSDGFSEARNPAGARLGLKPLIDAIRRSASGSALALADALRQRVDDFQQGSARSDDQTLIIMKVE